MPRILVLDDEPLIAMMVEDWLMDLGHEIVGPAHSVASALSLLEQSAPDAAILDISLAGETSYAVADVLAARGIPFVFATGRSIDGLEERFRSAPTLSKPFDLDALTNVIAQLTARQG